MKLSAERVADLLSDPRARQIREGARGAVWRVETDEGPAVLKVDRPPTLRSRLGNALRGTRAARAAAAGAALREAGILAPEPLGVLEESRRSVLLARWIEGPTLSEAWEGASRAAAKGLAEAAAELAAALHLAGFRCRDLKPPNVIVSKAGLVLVDLDDVRRAAHVPARLARRNLSALDAYGQLGTSPLGVGARWASLLAYAQARDLDPRGEARPLLAASRRKLKSLRSQSTNSRAR